MIPFVFKRDDSVDHEVVKGYQSTYNYIMRFCGLYPDFRGFWYYISGAHLNTVHLAYIWFLAAYMISTYYAFAYRDMELLSYELCYGLVTLIWFTVTHYTIYKRDQLDSLFRKVGRGFFTYEKPIDSEEEAIIDECNTNCRKTFQKTLALTTILAFWTCIIPPLPKAVMGDYSSIVEGGVPVNKHLALPTWNPYPTDTHLTYWTMWMYQALAGCTEAYIIGATCILYCNFCTIINRELKLLRFSLGNIKNRAIHAFKMRGYSLQLGQKYENSQLYQVCLVHCIDESIKHHIELKQFHGAIQNLLGFPIFAIFSGSALTISSPMFMFLQMIGEHEESSFTLVMNIFQYTIIIFGFTYFLANYCLFGQSITDESALLHFAFYDTPWPEAGLNFRRKVLMGMIHSRKPFVLTAHGLASASSETLVDMLKTVYSYFNLLAAT
uniref:Odorant receptor n=1 Tax=Apolygus lucorum TaxID=248454 RepID=A0A1Q1NIM0_APOLU|nr:olfactory receptor [Apolygus lucorum]